jgi:riboflavin kinase/FMN adenylyltransferase
MFDGVHLGHRRLLGRVVELARAGGLAAGAVTFDRHPLEVLRPGSQPPLISSLRQRVELLGEAGMDWVAVLPFTPELSRRSAEDFAEEVLFDRLQARALAVGANFRFGHKAAGDVELLARLGRPRGIEVAGVDLAEVGGAEASSTRVRAALAAGDVGAAAAMLGRAYAFEGRVVTGDRRGRQLGVPTANLRPPARSLVPGGGIYAGHLRTPSGPFERAMPAVTNVGVNPTFGGTRLRVEAHVLDADADLYGRRVTLTFSHRLRDELRFERVDELVAQMQADIAEARRLLAAPVRN